MAALARNSINLIIVWLAGTCLILAGLSGCYKATDKVFTIGIVSFTMSDNPPLEGFRAGMAELGYVEGKDLKYIYKKINDQDKKDMTAGIKEVISQGVDVLLTLGKTEMVQVAKELVQGTATPVLFCGEAWPVENGLVESLVHPGGNVTGVRPADGIPKALEWLSSIVPDIKTIWVPYDPYEDNSGKELSKIKETASRLGIGILCQKVKSVEEAVSAIEDLPNEVNAVFIMPSPVIDRNCDKLNQAAISRRMPIGASLKVDDSVLISLSSDFFAMGKKTARLAQQIDQGIRPADLHVETSEVALTINLSTAEKIGISIPDDILLQAKRIVR